MTTKAIRRRLPMALLFLLVVSGCSGEAEGSGVATAGDGQATTDDTSAAEDSTTPADDEGLAFAACMREEGIDMPDPEPGEGFMSPEVLQEYDRDTIEAAMTACEDLIPAQAREVRGEMDEETQLALAECLREQGIDVPDDFLDSGLPEGVDRDELMPAMDECREVMQ